mgnify:CR=1 FL=1
MHFYSRWLFRKQVRLSHDNRGGCHIGRSGSCFLIIARRFFEIAQLHVSVTQVCRYHTGKNHIVRREFFQVFNGVLVVTQVQITVPA